MANGVSIDLAGIRASWDELEHAERPDVRRLAQELADWIEEFYVELPEVRARGFDPVAALRAARRFGDIDRVVRGLEDRHTFVTYRRVTGHRSTDDGLDQVGTLQLPVRIGAGRLDGGGPERFWITDVAKLDRQSEEHELPRRGDEVTHWNGVPLERVMRRLGTELRGAHPVARRRIGLRALTRRVVEQGSLPDEDWVVLTCRRRGERVHHRLEWREGDVRWPAVPHTEAGRFGDRVRIGQLAEPDEMVHLLLSLREQSRSGRPLLLDLRGNAGGSVHGAIAVFEAVTGLCGSERLRFQFRGTDRLDRGRRASVRGRSVDVVGDGFLAPHRLEGAGAPPRGSSTVAMPGARAADGRDRRKVAVLVDASTFSAAEILTAMLRAEGALVFGTDECTGGGPHNPWTVAALRRLCPTDWVCLDGAGGSDESLRSYCARSGYRIGASWTDAGTRYWRLCAGASRLPNRLAVADSALSPEALAVYDLGGNLGSAAGFEVDLQLSVRRTLIRVDGDWVPIGRQGVDHVLRLTRRDLLEEDVDLLDSAFRLLSGDARVARSGSETPPSSGRRSGGGSTEETSP